MTEPCPADALQAIGLDPREAVAGLVRLQNADGGFSEAMPGDPSGCWTTAELYAAFARLERTCPEATPVLDRIEAFLVQVLQSRSEASLPYEMSAAEPDLACGAVDPTAAFLVGYRHRHAEDSNVVAAARDWLRAARAAPGHPGSGFGALPGAPTPRTYSTAYAILALGEEARDDAITLASWQCARTGAWAFRPGTPRGRLPTALALWALRQAGQLTPEAQVAGASWLAARLQEVPFLDEDSFSVPQGFHLSFTYAPYFVATAQVLGCASTRPLGAASLARLQHGGQGVVRAEDFRTWHLMDRGYGYSDLLEYLQAMTPAERAQVADTTREQRREHQVLTASTRLPSILRREARALLDVRQHPERIGQLVATHVERLLGFAWILNLACLSMGDEDARAQLLAILREGPRGMSDVFALSGRRARQKLHRPALVEELNAALRRVQETPHFKQLRALRNDVAHARPVLHRTEALQARAAWADLLGEVEVLERVRLVVVRSLIHDMRFGGHLYAWRGLGERDDLGTVRVPAGLTDGLVDGEGLALAVFVLDRARPDDPPLSLAPFVVHAECASCGTARVQSFTGHAQWSEDAVELVWRCTEGCGLSRLSPPLPLDFGATRR